VDTWYHVVVRKDTSNSAKVHITEEGAAPVNQVMSPAANPGGLQRLRLGVNRNAGSLFRMDMANVQIYDDASVDLDTLLAEGPQLVPEASSLLLALLGAPLLLRRRKG
jgi:hypothetical protein